MEDLKSTTKKGRRKFEGDDKKILEEEIRNFSLLCSCKISLKYALLQKFRWQLEREPGDREHLHGAWELLQSAYGTWSISKWKQGKRI